jgi:hypothetical protein
MVLAGKGNVSEIYNRNSGMAAEKPAAAGTKTTLW